jgi:hypothetical protein
MDLHCKKCCTGRSGDVLGAPCRTFGCDGIIEEQPTFASLVDRLPEPMTCGRRRESGMDDPNSPFVGAGQNLDHWDQFKSNGDRVCSYCGSLHPEDMFRLVNASAEAAEDVPYTSAVEIEPSDKGYKIYVHQPGVRNAHEGGIKFYKQHLTQGQVTEQQNAEYALAVKKSKARFERYLNAQFGDVAVAPV